MSDIPGLEDAPPFDINKAVFKLTVRVRPEDVPRPEALVAPAPSSSSGSTSATLTIDKDASLATEIYVPLVHYASDKVLSRFNGEQSEESPVDSRAGTPVLGSRHPSISDLSASWKSSVADTDLPLSLSISASAGHWSVDGQLLKWWYPVPTADEGERTYTITISRAGGAIKAENVNKRLCGFWDMLACCCPFL